MSRSHQPSLTRRHVQFPVLLFLAIALCLIVLLLPDADGGAVSMEEESTESLQLKQKRLLEVRENLKANIERLETVRERERSLVEELEKLDFELELLSTQIRILELQRQQYTREIKEISEEIARRRNEISQQEEVLSKRLCVMYKRGEWTSLRVLLNAKTISDVAHNLRMMRYIAQVDLTLIRQHRSWISILTLRTEELNSLEKKVSDNKQEMSSQEKELSKKKRVKEVFLEKIRNQKDEYERRQERLEKAAEELETWILSQKSSRQSGDFEAYKKKLPWPVRGKVKKLFGRRINPRFQTYTFSHGISISADIGTPVGVVAAGTVRFAGWFQGYGNLIIVQHEDDYYSLYGHLSEISVQVGDRVKQLAIIGRAGDTASDAGAVLHFEIRHKGTPLNPQKWLKPR